MVYTNINSMAKSIIQEEKETILAILLTKILHIGLCRRLIAT